MRWPGVIKQGEVINEIASLTDFLPTFAAAAGEPDIVGKLKKGHKLGDTTFKVHIDGYNLVPFLSAASIVQSEKPLQELTNGAHAP